MDSGDENTGRVASDKSLESGGHHNQKPLTNNHQQFFCTKNSIKLLLLLTAAVLSCFILYKSSTSNIINFILSSNPSLPISHDGESRHGNSSPSENSSPVNNPSPADFLRGNLSSPVFHKENNLEKVLNKAATANKTVIITTLNAAWTEPNSVFDLFLESFKIGDQTKALLDHLVVVAVDQKAYSRCLQLNLHCYALTTEGVDFSGEAHYMSEQYMKMMWRRLEFLGTVVQTGYNFIFTDTDIMWFRNPFPQFYLDTDFQIACDQYLHDPTNLNNRPNGGFMYAQSNSRTIQFYKFWYASKFTYPTTNEQDVLNIIKFDPFIKEIGLSIRFLDTAYFGGFCEPSKDLNLVCTMHANCCTVLEKKIHDLKMLIEDWKKYLELPIETRKSNPPAWSGPRSC